MNRDSVFYEAFAHMERFGPGSAESTARALQFFPAGRTPLSILDVGCGIGTHTLLLAERFPQADITAIDVSAPHIARLNETASERGLSDRLHGIVMSMFEMTFPDASFDLIWSEGAIYIAGFPNGLRDWRRLLKKDGCLICSEISWLNDHPSAESRAFWEAAYPDMNTIPGKLEQIRDAGYEPTGFFICPVSDWTVHYYDPIEKNLAAMRARHGDSPEAAEVIASLQAEIDLYRRHPDDYSYVFYAMRRQACTLRR